MYGTVNTLQLHGLYTALINVKESGTNSTLKQIAHNKNKTGK
jgi:hypothetical protein